MTEIPVSLSTIAELEAVLPKNTERCPAAPEKFWPVMVSTLPAAPLPALRPVTMGARLTTSKSFSASRPFEERCPSGPR